MKQKITKALMGLLVIPLFLSGCFSDDAKKDDAVPEKIAKEIEEKKENPEELFYTLFSGNTDIWLSEFAPYLPDRELLLKNNSEISVNGTVDTSNLALGVPINGDINFSASALSEIDYSDKKSPRISQDVSFEIASSDKFLDVAANLLFFVGDDIVAASLSDLDVSIDQSLAPSEQVEILKVAASAIQGKWYGATFDEIDALLLPASGLQISSLFSYQVESLELFYSYFDDFKNNPKKFVTYKSFIESDDDMYWFEYNLDPKIVDEFYGAYFDLLPIQSFDQEMKDEIIEGLKKSTKETFKIGFNKENPKYYSMHFPAFTSEYDVEKGEVVSSKIEGKENIFSVKDSGVLIEMYTTEANSVKFSAENNEFNFTVTDSEEILTPIKGTYSDDGFKGNIFDKDGQEQGKFNFSKTSDNVWSGDLYINEGEVSFNFEDISLKKGNFLGKVKVSQSDNQVFALEISYILKELKSFSAQKPSYSSFVQIQSDVTQAILGAAPSPVVAEPTVIGENE